MWCHGVTLTGSTAEFGTMSPSGEQRLCVTFDLNIYGYSVNTKFLLYIYCLFIYHFTYRYFYELKLSGQYWPQHHSYSTQKAQFCVNITASESGTLQTIIWAIYFTLEHFLTLVRMV